MSSVAFLLTSGTQGSFGVDYEIDEAGRLLILDKVRTDHTAREIMSVAPNEWVWVQVNGLATA